MPPIHQFGAGASTPSRATGSGYALGAMGGTMNPPRTRNAGSLPDYNALIGPGATPGGYRRVQPKKKNRELDSRCAGVRAMTMPTPDEHGMMRGGEFVPDDQLELERMIREAQEVPPEVMAARGMEQRAMDPERETRALAELERAMAAYFADKETRAGFAPELRNPAVPDLWNDGRRGVRGGAAA